MVDGKRCARVVARQQLSHVARNPGETLETELAVEEIGNGLHAHSLVRNEIEHDTRIELAGARAHGHAVERREAHRALDAAACEKRTHGGAAAEVGDDRAASRSFGRNLRQPLGNVLIRKAVEAIAAHTLIIEASRERVEVGMRRMTPMKGGVETGNLRYGRVDFHHHAYGREIVRLVQRREFLIGREPSQHRLVDEYRPGVVGTAVHDAVADGAQFKPLELPSQSRAWPMAAGRSGISAAG